MKRFVSVLAWLALLLAGCEPVASPIHYEYDDHTTTTAAAELAQEHNQPVCVGLVILGSCNTTATQTQAVRRPASVPQTAAQSGANLTWADVGKAFLIAGMITALFVMLVTGLRWIFPSSDEGSF